MMKCVICGNDDALAPGDGPCIRLCGDNGITTADVVAHVVPTGGKDQSACLECLRSAAAKIGGHGR